MAPNQEGHREEMRVRSDCLRHNEPCQCSARMMPNQEDQERQRQRLLDRATWEAGHRVVIDANVNFPGSHNSRQQFQRQEDKNLANRTSHFLEQHQEQGASSDRFATTKPLQKIDTHQHCGGHCQVLMVSCSSEALLKIKRDPLMEIDDEDESLAGSITGSTTGSTTSNTTNEEEEVRVE